MDKNDSMMLVLSELKGMRSDISTLTTDVAELKNGFQLMQEDIADLKADVAVLKADVAELKDDVAELKNDVAVLKADMVEVKADVAELKNDVAVLKTDMVEVKADVAELKDDVAVLKADMIEVKEDVADIKVQQKENTRFISALIDGQTVIEIRFDTMHSDIHSDIYDLRARTSNLENVTGRILFNMESAKCANF